MRNVPYREAIGCMMYIQLATRPDLAYAISMVSRFSNNPGVAHWQAVKRILRYLKGTKHMKLRFSNKGSDSIVGYSDADWAGDWEDRRSTTSYLFMSQGGAISWNSKKQPTVALSTTEAEYMALTSASQEALWLRRLMREVPCSQRRSNPTYVWQQRRHWFISNERLQASHQTYWYQTSLHRGEDWISTDINEASINGADACKCNDKGSGETEALSANQRIRSISSNEYEF